LHFGCQIGPKKTGVAHGGFGANYDFTVLKCEHVSRAGEATKFLVQRRHSPVAHDQDRDRRHRRNFGARSLMFPDERAGDVSEPLQSALGNLNAALEIS
jgi:hypothetical protein